MELGELERLSGHHLVAGFDAGPADQRGQASWLRERGLANVPRAWCHEADKERGIYEFRKGALRLFFFKGQGNDIAVCTTGLRKDQSKADRSAVALADKLRNAYFAACKANQLEVLEDDAE